jgi:3-oxoacyl-[acyl-carrier-protein] synthase III
MFTHLKTTTNTHLFAEQTGGALGDLIKLAISRSGHKGKDMDYVLMNQVKNSTRAHILEGIDVPQDHTDVSLIEFGHIGPAASRFIMPMAPPRGVAAQMQKTPWPAAARGFGGRRASSAVEWV